MQPVVFSVRCRSPSEYIMLRFGCCGKPWRHDAEPLLRGLPGLQEGRDIAAQPQLRYPQLLRTQPGIQRAVSEAVAIVQPLAGALVHPSTNQALHVGLREHLQRGLGDAAKEVAYCRFGGHLDKVFTRSEALEWDEGHSAARSSSRR